MKVQPSQLPFKLAADDPQRNRRILHVSDIYNDYYKKTNPKKYGQHTGDPDLLFAAGLAWEQYFEKTLIANGLECYRPGEQVVEWKGHQLAFSPDLILVGVKDRIGEIKLTWMSSKLKPTDKDFAKYLTQGKMYGYFLGIQQVTWFVNHIVGKYGHGAPLPQMRVWEVEFTKRELKDEVTTMMRHAEDEGLFEKAEAGLLHAA